MVNGLPFTAYCQSCFKKREFEKKQNTLNKHKIKNEEKPIKYLKPKKKEKGSILDLKEKCWKLCSEYNRRKSAGKKGFTVCVTCKIKRHWKKLQAGHFIPGRNNAYLFVDDGIWPQCEGCNCYEGGKIEAYELFLIGKVGNIRVKQLKALKTIIRSFTEKELEEKIEDYKQKIKEFDKHLEKK